MMDVLSAALKKENLVFRREIGGSGTVTDGISVSYENMKFGSDVLATLSSSSVQVSDSKSLGWDSKLYLKDSEIGFGTNAPYLTLSDADGPKVTVSDGKKLEWAGQLYLKDGEIGSAGTKVVSVDTEQIAFETGKSLKFNDVNSTAQLSLTKDALSFTGGAALTSTELKHDAETLAFLSDTGVTMQAGKTLGWDTQLYLRDSEMGFNSNAYLTLSEADGGKVTVSDGRKLEWAGKTYLKDGEIGYNSQKLADISEDHLTFGSGKDILFLDGNGDAAAILDKDLLTFEGGVALGKDELYHGDELLAILNDNEIVMQENKSIKWDTGVYIKDRTIGSGNADVLLVDNTSVNVLNNKTIHFVDSSAVAQLSLTKDSLSFTGGTALTSTELKYGESTLAVLHANDVTMQDNKSFLWDKKLYLKNSEMGFNSSAYLTLSTSVGTVADDKKLEWADKLYLKNSELGHDGTKLVDMAGGAGKSDLSVTDDKSFGWADKLYLENSEIGHAGSPYVTLGSSVVSIADNKSLTFKSGATDALSLTATELKYAGVSLAAFDSDKITMDSSKTIRMARSPTDGFDLANKTYVDSVASGLDVKQAVKWLSPFGAADALTGLSGSVAADDRVLVSNRTDGKENGIYVASAGAWSRSADLGDGAPITGVYVYSLENSTGYVALSNATDDYVGTHAMTWTVFNSRANLQYSTGLQFDGNVLSVSPTVFGSATAYPSAQVTGLDQAKRVLYVNDDRTALTSDAGFTYDPSTGLTTFGVTCTSDARLKTDIAEVQCSDVIHKLRPVQYKWKDADADQRTKYGFLAQEVQELLPSVVNKTDDRYGVEYMNFIALLVAEVQKLRKDVDAKLA